jgi:hypothetical protein
LTEAGTPLQLTRADLDERTVLVLHRGRSRNPDVLLVDSERGRVVVKDFAPRSWLVRWTIGRWSVRREVRAYRRLEGHPAVPQLLGVVDPLAFAVEHRGGTRFSRRRPWTFSPEFGRQLAGAVRELHARGVAHLDLRHRSNVRADMNGRPVLIDFGSAVTFRPGSLGARFLLPLLAVADRYALRKWSNFAGPHSEGGEGSDGGSSEAGRGASRPT